MANGDIHTRPYGSRWVNKVEGNSRPSNIHDTKDEAQREGREMAIRNKVEHLIHTRITGSRSATLTAPIQRPGRAEFALWPECRAALALVRVEPRRSRTQPTRVPSVQTQLRLRAFLASLT